ncbi:DUF4314 domain-containing protein [Streptomyces sp. AA1529]|uniref:DUF4314 domain-containing protein n=1 Tax=Streptomyces sp. AA1529 TaxID=1203257 RepID=UPI0002D6C50D|nr:DUF4314 domain-containing protein [Streptomyces sp. AA1529]
MNFAKGDRIELVHTSDPHTRLEPGDLGTVRRYDPLLQHLYIDWDNGSRLALLLDAGDCACHAPPPKRLWPASASFPRTR